MAFLLTSVVSLLLGGGLGVGLERRRAAADRRLTAAIQQIGVAGLCADALRAAAEARPETERRLLERRMASALEQADEMLVGAAQPDLPIPNLIEGVKRARQYAASNTLPDVVKSCDRVSAALNNKHGP